MNNEEVIIAKLLTNLEFIQTKIEEIKQKESLDIKQISDLQRYTEMQNNTACLLYTSPSPRD